MSYIAGFVFPLETTFFRGKHFLQYEKLKYKLLVQSERNTSELKTHNFKKGGHNNCLESRHISVITSNVLLIGSLPTSYTFTSVPFNTVLYYQ